MRRPDRRTIRPNSAVAQCGYSVQIAEDHAGARLWREEGRLRRHAFASTRDLNDLGNGRRSEKEAHLSFT
jgi:hypothetical protein